MSKYTGIPWRLKQQWRAIRRWWYRFRFGIRIGINHSMLPALGKGKYVDVVRRGDYIEIRDHSNAEPFTIRLIPYQPNHGVMVEYVNSAGRVGWRTHCSSREFLKMGSSGMEVRG